MTQFVNYILKRALYANCIMLNALPSGTTTYFYRCRLNKSFHIYPSSQCFSYYPMHLNLNPILQYISSSFWYFLFIQSYKSTVFSGVRVIRSLVLCVCFIDHYLSLFFWSLCYLFFDLRILITHMVSSNFLDEVIL